MKSSVRLSVVGLALGLMALGAACAPPPAAGPPPAPTTNTVTGNVTFACTGVGFSAGTPIPNQTVPVSVTVPLAATAGGSAAVSVDVSPLSLPAAPTGINLNAFNIPGKVRLSGTGGTFPTITLLSAAVVPGVQGVPTSFGSEVSPAFTAANIPAASGSVTAVTAGTLSVTTGALEIVSGSSGFTCSVVGSGVTATVPVS